VATFGIFFIKICPINILSTMTKDFWNERYAQHQTVYGAGPNEFFKEQLQSLTPGKILLPAEGEGRNALYAASLGWRVTAYDYSEVAKTKTLEQASALGITSIEYEVKDLSQIQLPAEEFDAIALIYVHLPLAVRKHLLNECIKSLKSGGILILEVFSKEQLQYNSGGPKDATLLYSLNELAEDFAGLKIMLQQEVITTLKEGAFHSGPASVVRFVAVK
jgi:ubiquinone/menaquinone biosynthesis C-methylase UbiE